MSDEGPSLGHDKACLLYTTAFAFCALVPCLVDLTTDPFGIGVLVCGATCALLAVLHLDEWLEDVWPE